MTAEQRQQLCEALADERIERTTRTKGALLSPGEWRQETYAEYREQAGLSDTDLLKRAKAAVAHTPGGRARFEKVPDNIKRMMCVIDLIQELNVN